MSRPVPVLNDRAVHGMRNAVRGDQLFVPRELIVQAFMFIVATAARRFNVGIVAYAMMPNHIHLIIRALMNGRPSDTVEFRRFVLSNFSLFINAYWRAQGFDTRGAVMCRDSTGNAISILDAETEESQIIYAELNAVRAGLETRPERMEGAISQRRWLTQPKRVTRPRFWFRKQSWEEEEMLQLTVPPKVEERGETPESFQKRSQEALNIAIRKVHAQRRAQGLKARRLSDIRKDEPTMEPGHSAADYSEALFVGKCPEQKAKEYHNVRAFRRWHEDSRQRQKDGEEGVVFPPGTYQAAKRYGVEVADMSLWEAPVRRNDEGRLMELYASRLE